MSSLLLFSGLLQSLSPQRSEQLSGYRGWAWWDPFKYRTVLAVTECNVNINILMETQKLKNFGTYLNVKAVTWYKDSHSLFDYQATKTTTAHFQFPLGDTKDVTLYRKRQSCTVEANDDGKPIKFDKEEFQMLTRFGIKIEPSMVKLNFRSDSQNQLEKIENERVNTDESSSSCTHNEEETYLIVRKLKDHNKEPKGYKLEAGSIIKLGRVEYYISEVRINGKVKTSNSKAKGKVYANRKVLKYSPETEKAKLGDTTEKPQCKICLQETETPQNFLFTPCVCSGSCGSVHFECLLQWIDVKVRKQVYGGTLHYNFQKFMCQVCRHELPMIIDVNGTYKEMLPIEKPLSNYIILEGACEKSKSVMVLTNVAKQGLKIGRGHDCEIRITDISVSRNHAIIKEQNNAFYIFDNKSKFGTLIKEDEMTLELNKTSMGIQIGRTVVTFELKRKEKEPNTLSALSYKEIV